MNLSTLEIDKRNQDRFLTNKISFFLKSLKAANLNRKVYVQVEILSEKLFQAFVVV